MNIFKILGLLLLSWLLLSLSLYLYLYRPHPGDSTEVAFFYLIGILTAYFYSFAVYMVVGVHYLSPSKKKNNMAHHSARYFNIFLPFFFH